MNVSLAQGPEVVAIPGPSVVPQRVLAAMHRAMPDIYAGDLVDLTDEVFDALPALARTSSRGFITISNGHGAWEMALTNTLSRGDKILVLDCGRFAAVWADMAEFDGLEVELVSAAPGRPNDPGELEARLRADAGHDIKAVLTVHVDTASSVRNDVSALRRAIDAAGHPALFMVDCIASLACERYEMDEWGVDVTIGASQKGLMMPPGLGFVWAGERALAAHAAADLRTRYWDWTARTEDGPHYLRYCGTPPVANLYALQEALRMIDEEGMEQRWARHSAIADAVRAAVAAWGAPQALGFHVTEAADRADSVTMISTGDVDSIELARICREGCGVTLGSGIGGAPGTSFRIGHMGHVNAPMILGVIGTVEAALLSMSAPIAGSGVAAASASLGTALTS